MAARKTILAVDDDPGVLRVVAGLLCRDYDLQTVASGPEALKFIGEKAPDLIILDIAMPPMSGLAVLEEALQLDPDLRIVMLTGDTDLDVVLRAMSLGAQGYITKPFSGEDLKNEVDHFLHPCEKGSSVECPWHTAPGAASS